MAVTPEAMKRINTNLIYKSLIELKTATKLELADNTNISLTTIRSVCEELVLNKEIKETQLDVSSGGRRAQRYILNPHKNLILSFYFHEDGAVYQVANLNGETLETGTKKFNLCDVTKFIDTVIAKHSISAIGIGVDGIVRGGKIYSGCDINRLKENNLGEMISEKYNLPVVLENEMNAVTYGYANEYLSKHDECQETGINMTYIDFGKTGVRAGLVTDGKIIHGSSQFAGELGFMPVSSDKKLGDIISSSFGFENSLDAICRTIAIIGCVTNPAVAVLTSDFLKLDLQKAKQLSEHLKKYYLSDAICPKILIAEDYQSKYLSGLNRLTLEHIIPLLPL